MKFLMDWMRLRQENAAHAGTAACSQGNRQLGFRPAFLDMDTMTIHESRFVDGSLAPIHMLDGLPGDVVLLRSPTGRVLSAKKSLISGFVRKGFFYTRTAAARAAAQWPATA